MQRVAVGRTDILNRAEQIKLYTDATLCIKTPVEMKTCNKKGASNDTPKLHNIKNGIQGIFINTLYSI